MIKSHALLSLLSVCAVRSVTAARFQFEQEHLTEENIDGLLNERLPKQSRIQGSDVVDYISTFFFSPIDVTSNHETEVSHDLKGPDNCKVFPGDAKWPSKWLWTGLELVTQGGLIKPVPLSSICYSNGTGEVDEDACEALAENWNTARYMYATESTSVIHAMADDLIEAMTRSK